QMEREQCIVFNNKGKVKHPLKPNMVEGTFRANERGFGLVTIDPEEDDIYIPKEATGIAMDGDTVAIENMTRANSDMDR
ncbi:ribonuclease R, partial [Enterococcus faecium]